MFETMEYTTSNQRLKVPLKLLHINETSYTNKWMKQTYKYHRFFDETLNESRPQEGESNLHQWKTKAISMTHEIKQKGMIAGRRELCRVAKEEYGLTIPGRIDSNRYCTDVDDILCVISNSDWYYDNLNQKRNIIYHFLYGLTRPGNNVWLINAEKKWMDEKGIVYDYDNIATKRKTRIKGFVYSIMHSMYSNYIQKTFRKKMLSQFNEFITVREKVRNASVNSKYHYKKHQFGNNQGYIVSTVINNDTVKNKCLPDLLTVGKNWVSECKKYGLSLDDIKSSTENFFYGNKLINFTNKTIVNDVTVNHNPISIQKSVTESINDIQRKTPSDEVLKHLKKGQFNLGK